MYSENVVIERSWREKYLFEVYIDTLWYHEDGFRNFEGFHLKIGFRDDEDRIRWY